MKNEFKSNSSGFTTNEILFSIVFIGVVALIGISLRDRSNNIHWTTPEKEVLAQNNLTSFLYTYDLWEYAEKEQCTFRDSTDDKIPCTYVINDTVVTVYCQYAPHNPYGDGCIRKSD